MSAVLLAPFALVGLLSLVVFGKLALLSRRHKVPLGYLLNLLFHGYPVTSFCRVKGEMEAWGLIVEMSEIVGVYHERLEEGGKAYAAMEEELRQGVIRRRTGRG